jgi:hypothetical protein
LLIGQNELPLFSKLGLTLRQKGIAKIQGTSSSLAGWITPPSTSPAYHNILIRF